MPLCVCVQVCACACIFPETAEEGIGHIETAEEADMSVGKQTQVFWMSSMPLSPLSRLFSLGGIFLILVITLNFHVKVCCRIHTYRFSLIFMFKFKETEEPYLFCSSTHVSLSCFACWDLTDYKAKTQSISFSSVVKRKVMLHQSSDGLYLRNWPCILTATRWE